MKNRPDSDKAPTYITRCLKEHVVRLLFERKQAERKASDYVSWRANIQVKKGLQNLF
jgi:hypothetical protein